MSSEICPACEHALLMGKQSWHFVCHHCGYEKANLPPMINADPAHHLIDEVSREAGLKKLRLDNFQKLLHYIQEKKPNGGNLLEVGPAHGWFLDTANDHFNVLGIEPDKLMFHAMSARALPVRLGYFPDALRENERFDVIIFNDVIEHIPDIQQAIAACYQHLNTDGLLVLNLPSSAGFFYRLSKIVAYFGAHGFFERLWQKGLPSPHLHYFNSNNLSHLLKKNHFLPEIKGSLSTIQRSGLYQRMFYTGAHALLTKIFIYSLALMMLPLLKILPSDIIYVISRRE